MSWSGHLVLRPWIRDLILGSETVLNPLAVQLLEVLQEPEAPGPSGAPDTSDAGTSLLVSDGTLSVRCLLTREAMEAWDWEEKEFGFRGTEGQFLLLRDCEARVLVSERGSSAEFYLQVNSFILLPSFQYLERVPDCNQDPEVRRKLFDCLEEHLSEFTSPSPSTGISLSQLLDEVQEDQEHRGALVQLAENCLMLTSGHFTAPCPTRWATLRHQTMGEAMYTVPSVCLHISEEDQQILSSLGPGQRAVDLALQDLPQTLTSSSSSFSGTPALSGHVLSEEDSASVSLLSSTSLASPGQEQNNSQLQPSTSSAPSPPPPSSPQPNHVPVSPPLNCTPVLSSLGHDSSPHQVTRAQKTNSDLGLLPKNWQPSIIIRTSKGSLKSNPIWDPPKRHHDGSAFQYEYQSPCASLCAQVQAARLPPQLVAWALLFLMEPQADSELTQV
ncbi:adrenocortical dysplasia protein homolog isoform X2 [Erinaceus europaeus]|uniref:Adrenocortical dysplasia protein homolog isoform X2 n=1 Tax=Erinaceus europaeus TaxID=9365 RepID=A0ABM3WXK8_ERIEU|nr:adrenocortical dysplasia protein homolog isoform X2 [Erinaceus europaeus]